jgi:hypothetical protein
MIFALRYSATASTSAIGASKKLCDDGESIEVAIFSGGDERQRAIRYADREYGEIELELEPYQRQQARSD